MQQRITGTATVTCKECEYSEEFDISNTPVEDLSEVIACTAEANGWHDGIYCPDCSPDIAMALHQEELADEQRKYPTEL